VPDPALAAAPPKRRGPDYALAAAPPKRRVPDPALAAAPPKRRVPDAALAAAPPKRRTPARPLPPTVTPPTTAPPPSPHERCGLGWHDPMEDWDEYSGPSAHEAPPTRAAPSPHRGTAEVAWTRPPPSPHRRSTADASSEGREVGVDGNALPTPQPPVKGGVDAGGRRWRVACSYA
jgi:hypothetical protein